MGYFTNSERLYLLDRLYLITQAFVEEKDEEAKKELRSFVEEVDNILYLKEIYDAS